MKLCAIYSVYNGLELLDGSIKQIEKSVDTIIIGYQEYSHYGIFAPGVKEFMQRYEGRAKFKVVCFKPRFGEEPKASERRKMNQLITVAKNMGNTHFFMSATDHYYETKQFVKAKEIAKNYDATASKMYTYFKNPSWRLTPIETYYMPFICRLTRETMVRKGDFPVYVDPSVCVYPHDDFYEFGEDELMMHHFSFIRKDIKNKLVNAAARRNFKNDIPKIIEDFDNFNGVGEVPYFKDNECEIVDNIFNIPLF